MKVQIADWIVSCLQMYGNCSLPEKLIRRHGFKAVEKALTEIIGCPVYIRVSGIDILSPVRKREHPNPDVYYIAETEVTVRRRKHLS